MNKTIAVFPNRLRNLDCRT